MSVTTESFMARFFLAAVCLILFGLAEAFLGSLVIHNPAVVADAGHNISDGGILLLFTGFEAVATYWNNHIVGCTGRRVTGIIAYTLTIYLIAGVVYEEAGQSQHHLGPWLVLPVGLVSFGLNYWLAEYTEDKQSRKVAEFGEHEQEEVEENANAQGISNHLKFDAALSVALIVGAFLAYGFGDGRYNAGTAAAMLLVVTIHNLVEIWELATGFHRAENHNKHSRGHHGHSHGPGHSH